MRLNGKCKTIIDHCRYIYRRCNIYDKALLHKKCSCINTKASLYDADNILQKVCYNPHIINKLEYSYNSAISLYYVITDLNDTMFDKCLNEQDDY